MPAPSRVPHVRNVQILPQVITGLVRNAIRTPRALRRQLLKSLWIELKRYSARNIGSVEPSELFGKDHPAITATPVRYDPLVAVALSVAQGSRTIFEIGTYLGETTWLFAHNNPQAHVYTLDLPGLEALSSARLEVTDPEYFTRWDRGQRFHATTEAGRITQLFGDSASFDFSAYRAAIDFVYIDGSHSYGYVRSDSEAALLMLSPRGTIVWDDYTYYPGIYRYLNELAPRLGGGIAHIRGTRLAVYRRSPVDDLNSDVKPIGAGRLRRDKDLVAPLRHRDDRGLGMVSRPTADSTT